MLDIEYLLWLQNFREATGNFLTPLMEWVSVFSIRWLLIVPVVLYWCINKRDGLFSMTSLGVSRVLNAVSKLTVCAYRPWIRDARIIPAGDSIKTATGYSFPSGHVMTATPVYASIAALYGKKFKLITWLCGLGLFLTALSRNYLGVHTPQDVIVGALMGIFAVYLTAKVFAYLDKNPEKENQLIILGLLCCVATVAYALLKSYPMDYVNGKLIVNPKSMMNDSFGDVGLFSGVLIGRYLEKKFVKFSPTGLNNFKGLLISAVGIAVYCWIMFEFRGVIRGFMPSNMSRFLANFVRNFFVIFLWPIVIKLTCKK